MKAVRIHSFGSPDVMQIEDIDTPRPNRGEVLVRVVAASVNPVDYKVRSGEFKFPGAHMPLTLGRDVSGVVEAVGRGVSGFNVGDEVMALLDADHGGYAEFVIVQSEGIAPKPVTIDHVHAAGVPLAALTAWQGLFDHGDLRRGERVLIHGAAGGVGHFAVQFAKNRGATVIATARSADAVMLRNLGADEVVDYEHEKFEERVHDIDLVFDLVAGDIQKRSWACLKKGGRMVSTLQASEKGDISHRGTTARHYMAQANRKELEEIGRMIDDGKVEVVVNVTMPLDEVRQAHDVLENEHIQGKLVLEVAEA